MPISEIFWTGLYTAMLGLVLSIVAVCYKSKCKTIKCGPLEIERDIETELKEDIRRSPSVDNPV